MCSVWVWPALGLRTALDGAAPARPTGLLRQLVTGGASFELEKSLAEGAGLRGGYSTPDTLVSNIQRNILIGNGEESKSLVRGRR